VAATTIGNVNVCSIGLDRKTLKGLVKERRYVIYRLFHCYLYAIGGVCVTPVFGDFKGTAFFWYNLHFQTKKDEFANKNC
jgi:hypothetical protein